MIPQMDMNTIEYSHTHSGFDGEPGSTSTPTSSRTMEQLFNVIGQSRNIKRLASAALAEAFPDESDKLWRYADSIQLAAEGVIDTMELKH
jgi:hypothetical protein